MEPIAFCIVVVATYYVLFILEGQGQKPSLCLTSVTD